MHRVLCRFSFRVVGLRLSLDLFPVTSDGSGSPNALFDVLGQSLHALDLSSCRSTSGAHPSAASP